MRELPRGPHRMEDRLVPEHRAVGAVVAHQDARRLALAYGLGEPRARLLITIGSLQDTEVGAKERGGGVAAHLHERRVDKNYRTVGRGRIADHDALGCALDHTAPGLRRPVVHGWLPGSSVSTGGALVRASSSRARAHSGEASRA